MCSREGTHQIVMSFSPPVVGCLLKKGLQKVRGSQAPQDPLATPLMGAPSPRGRNVLRKSSPPIRTKLTLNQIRRAAIKTPMLCKKSPST